MSNQFYCNRCGGLFNCSPKARPTWCDECRKQEQKEYQAEYYRSRKSELSLLRAANAELMEALNRIANTCDGFDECPVGPQTIAEIARSALSRAEPPKPSRRRACGSRPARRRFRPPTTPVAGHTES